MIQFSQAKDLLDRFMDGLTTEEEEQALADFMLHSDEVPEEWEAEREMFSSFATDDYAFSEEEMGSMVCESDNSPVADSHGAARHTLFIHRVAACTAFLLASAAVTLWFADYSDTQGDTAISHTDTTGRLTAKTTDRMAPAEVAPAEVASSVTKRMTMPRGTLGGEEEITSTDSIPPLVNPTEDSCEMPGFRTIMADISSEYDFRLYLREEANSISPALYAPARETEEERGSDDSPSLAQASTFDIPSININDVPGF